MNNVRESLLQRLRCKGKDSLALVEFPGVLLVAYKTILEGLQNRSLHPYIPFSEFLCPLPVERQTYNPRNNRTILVPPPSYATTEGFQFDLTPLKHSEASPEPLLLSLDGPLDDQELLLKLEKETTLDAGQCKGLVAALTREVGLIQGDILYIIANARPTRNG